MHLNEKNNARNNLRLIDNTHYGYHVLRLVVDEAPHMASSCHRKSKIYVCMEKKMNKLRMLLFIYLESMN